MEKDKKTNIFEKGEEFLEMFRKGQEFTQDLLRENERLRYRVVQLEEAQKKKIESPTAWFASHGEPGPAAQPVSGRQLQRAILAVEWP